MDKKEIIEFINKNPIAYMATIEGDKPRVRAMGTYSADESGIIFSMQSPKDVYKQLKKNPATEVCYYADGVQVRICGQMEEISDKTLKEQIVEKRTFYKPGVEKQGLDYVGAFTLKNAKATVLDMKNQPEAGAPKTWIDM